jgi:radical SAM family uncharacterized protein/radical SAM-linked protein
MRNPSSSVHASQTPPLITSASDDFLLHVEKPARYIGAEVNAVHKDPASVKLRIALAFPDAYEVGMSHLGLKILYTIVNSRPELYAERAFAPWPDREALLRLHGELLGTIETGTPLSQMDMVGFSLQYELCATMVLQMLDLGGIPVRAADRGIGDPLIVGGGPVASNPLPLSAFFDAFVVGDGEDVILELADAQVRWKDQAGSREDLLSQWKRIPGVWVPSLHQSGDTVHRRITADLSQARFPSLPVVPFCEIVHDRVGIEIARGCTRGCRFCQAGMLYRPVRERSADQILGLARDSLASTGWEEVSLLSLSSGDHSQIMDVVAGMTREFAEERVAVSLPSLRTDTFTSQMAAEIRKVRKTGFTLAPEASTERLRRVINKGNTEEDLRRAVVTAFKAGWRSLKLYFMIGLPFETDEDLDGIVSLLRKASGWANGGKITGSVSTFVPKSHTPFQWTEQISPAETERRRDHIRRHFHRGKVQVKFHDPGISFLEGVMARGDRRLAEVIELAYRKGARFDGWDDQLKYPLWMAAFRESDIDPDQYLVARDTAAKLPWGFIDTGVAPEYLLEEWARAGREELTPDCRFGSCTGCGVCDWEEIRPRVACPSAVDRSVEESQGTCPPESEKPGEPEQEPNLRRFRLTYAKQGRMRFLGHQDLIRVFYRTFRRYGMSLDYSKGFHPHPRLRFSPPLALGVESVAEFLDFDVVNEMAGVREILETLRDGLPNGITPESLAEIPLNEPALSAKIQAFTYEIEVSGSLSVEELQRRVSQFLSCASFEISKAHKGKARTRDLRQLTVTAVASGSTVTLILKADQSGSVHPMDAFAALLGLTREEVRGLKIVKTSVTLDASCPGHEGLRHVQ